MGHKISEKRDQQKETLKSTNWARQWGWQMFNVNLGTGAVSIVIGNVPYAFNGQHALGTIFFLLNVVIYIINLTMTLTRAIKHPRVFKQSFYDRSEAVWFPTSMLGMATIMIGTMLYGVPRCGQWLIVTVEVWYYIFIFLAAMAALRIQSGLRTVPRKLTDIAVPDVLEIYPLMFIGVVGGNLVSHLAEVNMSRALTVWMFSLVASGLGFFVGLLKLSVWMMRDMLDKKLPAQAMPSNIIYVGVPGFTAFTLVNLGQTALTVLEGNDFLSGLSSGTPPDGVLVGQVAVVFTMIFSLMLVGMACWVLLCYGGWAFMSFVKEPFKPLTQRWAYTWWAWTFPLTGIVGSFSIYAETFPSKAFGVLNIIVTLFMVIMWFINITGTAHMLWTGSLPGTSSDFDEHEFIRQRDGVDSQSDAESGQTRVQNQDQIQDAPGQNGGPHDLPGQDKQTRRMTAGRD